MARTLKFPRPGKVLILGCETHYDLPRTWRQRLLRRPATRIYVKHGGFPLFIELGSTEFLDAPGSYARQAVHWSDRP